MSLFQTKLVGEQERPAGGRAEPVLAALRARVQGGGRRRGGLVARGRAGRGRGVSLLVRQLGRGARALAHGRRVLGHARAEPHELGLPAGVAAAGRGGAAGARAAAARLVRLQRPGRLAPRRGQYCRGYVTIYAFNNVLNFTIKYYTRHNLRSQP